MISKDSIISKAIAAEQKVMVVAAPHDVDTIQACCKAIELNLCEIIFVGEAIKITELLSDYVVDESKYKIHDVSGLEAIAKKAMELLSTNQANMLMKGLIDTSVLLKTYLNKEYGLKTGSLLSHVGVLLKPDSKSYLITDAAMIIAPNVDQKQHIIENAVAVAKSLGIKTPNVANICAKEKPYDKMPATLDAHELQQRYLRGEIMGCVVSGPLQIDNAINKESCIIKNVDDPVCGVADIFVCPNIEMGNALSKGLKYLGGYEFAGVIVGGKVPIVLVSRADKDEEKLLSIALACSI